jgi:Fe-S cluster assembly protein SufD
MSFSEELKSLFVLPGDLTDGWRKKSWDRFLHLGLPLIKSEAFQYVPLLELYSKKIQISQPGEVDPTPHILPECKDSYLVFVDGHFQPAQSKIPVGIVVLPIPVAMKSYGLFLQNRIGRMLKEEHDPFAALNGAFQGVGLFLYIPPKFEQKNPVQLLHLFTKEQFASPRVQLFVGKMANLTLVQTVTGSCFCNSVVDCVVDEAAKCTLYDASLPSPASWLMQSFRATLKRDSLLETFHLTTGAKTVRTSLKVELAEENSEVFLRGISLLDAENQAHIHGLVEHQAPNCRSRQHFKSILKDQSSSSFEGKIFVHPAAQKTEAYQSAQSLLLSNEARSFAKPNLEIFADDVKASHGATVAQPDEEALFYFRSRGLSFEESRAQLVQGFCQELLQLIPFASLRSKVVL